MIRGMERQPGRKNSHAIRVVMIASRFPVRSETFLFDKFSGLLRAGFDVIVLTGSSEKQDRTLFPTAKDFWKRVILAPAVFPRAVMSLRWPYELFRTALCAPKRALRYLREVRRHGVMALCRNLYLDAPLIRLAPDIIHFEFGALARGRMYLKDALRTRIVVSFRGYDLNFSGLHDPRYYNEVWKHADMLHFLGRDLYARAQRRGCPPEKPFVLIPPAIDTEFFPGRQQKDAGEEHDSSPLRILSVGRLEWKKGYEFALAAIRLLVDQGIDCRYRIVGDGKYLEALAFARHQLGLKNYVEFQGAMTREQIRGELQQADVFLHAAVSEGFCNAVLEAQAMEVPVVCSDADGLPENVEGGVTGFVCPRRDSVAMAERLQRLALDVDLRRKMGRAGRERVCRLFVRGQQIEAFERMYVRLTGNERPAMQTASAEVSLLDSGLR